MMNGLQEVRIQILRAMREKHEERHHQHQREHHWNMFAKRPQRLFHVGDAMLLPGLRLGHARADVKRQQRRQPAHPEHHSPAHVEREVRQDQSRGDGGKNVSDGVAALQNAREQPGLLSGILQSGYSIGYILAAIASRLILPHFSFDMGWRVMFWVGGLPALLALYIRTSVPESEAWKQHRVADMKESLRTLGKHVPMMLSLMLMMTLFMFLSHGTQDLYPDFLKTIHHFSQAAVSNLAIFYNIGAVVGAMIFGMLSQRRGRRFAIVCAVALALVAIPVWAFGPTLLTLALGAFVMQAGVQGAWGVIPAHLNELSPDSVRGLVPGLAYQLGILFASPVNTIEHHLYLRLGYQWALGSFELVNIFLLAFVVMFGSERKGRSFFIETRT